VPTTSRRALFSPARLCWGAPARAHEPRMDAIVLDSRSERKPDVPTTASARAVGPDRRARRPSVPIGDNTFVLLRALNCFLTGVYVIVHLVSIILTLTGDGGRVKIRSPSREHE